MANSNKIQYWYEYLGQSFLSKLYLSFSIKHANMSMPGQWQCFDNFLFNETGLVSLLICANPVCQAPGSAVNCLRN